MSLTFDETFDLDEISERLKDPDPGVRRIAVIELGETAELDAADLVIKALHDESADVRKEAASALEEFEGLTVIEALIDALTDENAEVKASAALTLSENKDVTAAPLILKRYQAATDTFVQTALLNTLRPLCYQEAKPDALLALENKHAQVRKEAVGVLAYLKSTDALLALMSIAKSDENHDVRRAAMGSLIISKPEVAADTLISGLIDSDWRVREEAAVIIGKIKAHETLDALIVAMNDEYWQVRVKAASSLGKLKNPKAIPALGNALTFSISNLRKESAAALGEIAHVDALPLLAESLKDADPDVRKIAEWAIKQIK